MRLTRRTLIWVVSLSASAILVGLVAFVLYMRLELQIWNAQWGALDYNAELRSESAVLERIVVRLRPETVPASARKPKMYRTVGIDPDYYMAFTVDTCDVPPLVSSLEASGFRRLECELDDIYIYPPTYVPPAVKPWWPTQFSGLAVYRAGEGSGVRTWYIVSCESGEVWVRTTRGTPSWEDEVPGKCIPVPR